MRPSISELLKALNLEAFKMTTRLAEIERMFKLLDEVEDPICVNCDSPSHGTVVIVQEISKLVRNKDGTTKRKRKILIRRIHITGIPN